MTYGLSTRAFVEDGPVEQVAKLRSDRSAARTWHALNAASRIEIIEWALNAANDRIDGFPIAL